MGVGILILRLVIGLTMTAHGLQKLFGWFGGHGLEGAGKMFEQMGFIPGKRAAFFAGLAEGGGLLLALGLATPLGAMLVFSVMFVAVMTAHIKNGFFIQNRGYEYNLVLGLGGLSLAFTGPGPYSLDWFLGLPYAGLYWGLGAFGLGLVGGLLQLSMRKAPAPAKAQ
jgi:putative oxidoreductase